MISKTLKAFIIIVLFVTAVSAQTIGLPFQKQNINLSLLLSPGNVKAAITLTQIPTKFYRNNDSTATGNITIQWDLPGINGDFYYSRFPNVAANLRSLTTFPGDSILDDDNLDNSITFNVWDDSVTTGVYYCIIVNRSQGVDSTSIEFNMIIDHDLSPSNFSPDTTQTGDLSWVSSSPYTPYYHLIVSNKRLELTDDDNDGDREVKGINIIYQAITPNTSLTYRDSDPSGFYDNTKSPRLASGNTYYWILFNNYGNNPALSSDVISYGEVPNFVYDNPQSFQPAPQNLEPVSTSLTNLDTLQFRWSSVPGSNYHVYLYEEVEENNSVGSFLVFDTTITSGDTSVSILDANQLLVNTNYYWNVTAENSALFSASQIDSFSYSSVNTGKVRIETNVAIAGNPDLARVNIDIQLLGGNPSNLTYLTDESGKFNRELVAGNYTISAFKEGFNRLDTTVTIITNDSIDLVLNMTGNPTYFTGKIQIPSLTVIPKIKLLSPSLGDTMEVPGNLWYSGGTSAEYTFRANVMPGDWTLFPIADGYTAVAGDTADTTILFGDYLEIPFTFDLEEIPSRIITYVADDTGGVVYDFNLTFTKDANQQIFNGVNSPFIFPADPGIWTVTIDKAGYFSQSEHYQVEVFDRLDSRLDIIMIRSGDLSGTISDDSGQPLDFVTVEAIPQDALARYTQTTSAIDGSYNLSLKPGDYQISAQKNGYSSADTLITITSQQTIIYNPVLIENKSFVSGVVTDTSGTPVLGARVNYLYDMGTGFSAPSDSAGNYLLAVPSNISVKVYATKSGWSTSDTITVNIPENQTETHNFIIYKLNSTITGTVETIDQSQLVPMSNVLISAIDTSTQQVIYIDTTDQNGTYKVFVDAGTFWVRAARQYYITQQDTITLNSGDSVSVDFIMNKNFGSVSGTVSTNLSAPLANQVVTARRSSTGAAIYDTTDENGAYNFAGLEPGEIYTFSTRKIRHFVSPRDGYTYFVLGGVDTIGFDFTLTRANITSIEIVNYNSELPNNVNTQFYYEAREGTEVVEIEPPVWRIEYPDTMLFETATFSSTTNGLFEPKLEALDAGFSISVEDTANGASVIATVPGFSIYSSLNRQMITNLNIELKDHTGMVLNVDRTDIDASTGIRINLSRKIVPESKAISSEAESYGDSYNINTEVSSFLDPVILKLPIPVEVGTSAIENRSQGINVGVWSDNFLEWEILANSDLQTLPYYAVSNSITGTGEYIVLITSQPLGIHNIKILPNPFSPNLINFNDPLNRNLTGQVIAFDLTSLDIRQPFVTLKIYNMNGELVRELADQEPMIKGQVALIWDGKANNGATSRNGRYIVHLKVKDSTGEKEEIKSSVLVK
jgi:carboxypeptidase family protein/flagellar hook capping protein FlgD